jgi:hypothetical protein
MERVGLAWDVKRPQFSDRRETEQRWPRGAGLGKDARTVPNKSAGVSTNGRSIDCGSGRQVPTSPGIGSTCALLFSCRLSSVG